MEIVSAEAHMSQRREQLQPGWKTLFLLNATQCWGAERVTRRKRYDASNFCSQGGILEAVTPECGWLLAGNCDGALWKSSKKKAGAGSDRA